MMMTPSTGPLVVTPIFWNPSSFPMGSSYTSLINSYLSAVSSASGQNTNVFSVLNEYSGNNGQINYSVTLGTPVNDTHALPASGCRVARTDTKGIYADGSGYSACLDDAQLQTEINSVTAASGLPRNLSHIYVLYLPKHVESCFNPGSTTTSANACTINYQPSAAYCAYHSETASSAVYASMPYPVYNSGTGSVAVARAASVWSSRRTATPTPTSRSAPQVTRSVRRLPTRTPVPAGTTPAARSATSAPISTARPRALPGSCTTR